MAAPPIPSLESIMGTEFSVDEKAMAAVETWPSSRTNLLEEVRKYLADFLGADRELTSLALAFANIRTVGEKSKFGVVRLACLRSLTGPDCQIFSLIVDDTHATTDMPVYLVIKSIPTLVSESLPVPYAGLNRARKWVGHQNHLREILMGRMLNHLVQARITPHFPLIYEPFRVTSDVKNEYFAMELCHYTINQFMTHVKAVKVPEEQKITILRVCIIQLCQALAAAQHHYNFRHNDFHGGNAMMTYITRGTYTYKIGAKYYTVPNYGMCWKLIDFGFSSSDLFGHQDVEHALVHATLVDFTSLTQIYFTDMMRLLLSSVMREPLSKELLQFGTDILLKMDEIASEYAISQGISLRGLPDARLPESTQEHRQRTVAYTSTLRIKEGNVLDSLFAYLAEDYEVDASTVDESSESFYDINRSPASEDAFTLYEKSLFYVDDHGNLNRKGAPTLAVSSVAEGSAAYEPMTAPTAAYAAYI